MEFFRIRHDLPLMHYARLFNALSILTFLVSIFFLSYRGLNLSVEFTGGSVIEVEYSPQQAVNLNLIRDRLENLGVTEPSVQTFGSAHTVAIRLSHKNTELPAFTSLGDNRFHVNLFADAVLTGTGNNPVIKRVEVVGAQVGNELFLNSLQALFFVCIGIIIYLSLRFEWRFAVSALIANLHDIIIILGFFSFFQWEFSLSVLAAVLSVLGYSVNESVVVFDRVREILLQRRALPIPQVLDHAITTTMSRTIITHLCTQIMVTTMLLFGGVALHNFALALTIGICFGIYSSVLVSCPLVMWLGLSPENFVASIQKRKLNREDPNVGAVV